jgi:two-component system chemotaxis sensor kinase CheA
VLAKNRLSSVAREVHVERSTPQTEVLCNVTSDMDRLMDAMQVSLAEVRMQEIGGLFEKFEKVVANVAGLNDHPMRFETEGGRTHIDRFMAETIAGPLQQLLQFVVKERFESGDVRQASGKPETATLKIRARNEGCYTVVSVTEDGRCWESMHEAIASLYEEGGAAESTPAAGSLEERALELMSDVSDCGLGGLRSTLNAMGADISVGIRSDGETTYRITLPQVASVLRSMSVMVGETEYSVPLESVMEIVRLDDATIHEVTGEPCIRLRDHVFPLVDLRARLDGIPGPAAQPRHPAVG